MKMEGGERVNKAGIKSVIARNNENQSILAQALGLKQPCLSNRINGLVEFRLSEVDKIRRRYHLSPEETVDLFFDEVVS